MRIDLDHLLLAPTVVEEYWERVAPAFVAATLAAGWSPVGDEFGVLSPQGELRLASEVKHADGRRATFVVATILADGWSFNSIREA